MVSWKVVKYGISAVVTTIIYFVFTHFTGWKPEGIMYVPFDFANHPVGTILVLLFVFVFIGVYYLITYLTK